MSVTVYGPFRQYYKRTEGIRLFLQYGATAHIATYPLDDLNKVCEERLVNCRLWPARSPDLK
jgi:hypothetical protein